jgi:hypothetical protein
MMDHGTSPQAGNQQEPAACESLTATCLISGQMTPLMRLNETVLSVLVFRARRLRGLIKILSSEGLVDICPIHWCHVASIRAEIEMTEVIAGLKTAAGDCQPTTSPTGIEHY